MLPWENVLSIVSDQLLEWLLCRLHAVVLCSSYHGSDMIARIDLHGPRLQWLDFRAHLAQYNDPEHTRVLLAHTGS
jgi:hypothetical protein